MAAPRENLLSLGHLTGTDRDTFTNRREHSLKKSFNRSMTLQADFSTHQGPQHLRVMHLQQRWQELKDRERTAQQHNRQLLQQFEEAQGTLREMMARTAAMKTIRMEYERYLEENSPRWQQQLKEKTQAAQRKRMDEYLKMCLKNTEEEQVTKSSVDRPLLSQGATKKPQKVSAPQEYYSQNSHLDYNQDDTLQSTWLTHPQPQTVRFPVRVPYRPQGSSQAPPSFLPHPHPFQLQHLAATPGHHQPRPRQNPPGWASTQPDHSWFWTSGAAGMPSGYEALWGQLYMEEPPPERGVVPVVAEEAETSRAPSLKTERGGGSRSSHLSQELDIKPVRLSSGHTESSESGRDSSQASREKKRKREKRGRAQRTSSESERCSSQESSWTSSAIVVASVPAAQTSESEASSEKSSTRSKKTRRRVEEVAAESPRMEKVEKKRNRSKGDNQESHNEESQCTSGESEEPRSENAGNQSPDEKSESCRDESGSQREEGSGSVSIRLENGDADKSEQESSNSEQSRTGQKVVEVKGHEKEPGDGEEDDDEGSEEKEPNSQRDEEQEDRCVEDDEEVSARKNTIEEEEETGAEDEMEEQESDEDHGDDEEQSDGLKNEDGEIRKQASPQDEELDEDESEGSEGKIEEDDEGSDEEEDGGGEEDEEQRIDKAGELEEERDSEDSIISPQENRPKKIHIIPEESAEDDDGNDGSKTGSSQDDSNEISDEDDIENLLAPQMQIKKNEEKDLKTEEKPEAVCDKVEIFQVTSTKTDQQSDSDEFDHFYD
ncbi:sarcoplasmic reticulum histidine-rich calcium-binding protein-like [Thunnus albacares]|uniref:sarcoplasmic reticulum histidine-rich calcium-binding protein-like n=1 Tax=Thunnus albacares TaxID=8236 RepID=UPI001CF66B1F|nr:sarcoplasmic reticulum histidine-rich calcium-binding protein-like [Thunnus albacares]